MNAPSSPLRLACLALAAAFVLPARADIIPVDRLPTANTLPWSPGIPGGIPAVTAKATTAACVTLETGGFGDGLKDATAAIQAAIDSCPNGQYVHLPAGNYRTTADIRIWRSDVVLRGDGPDQTVIRPVNAGGIAIGAGVGDWPTQVAMPSGAAKGATSITVADASAFTVGQLITITLEDKNNPLLGGIVDDQWKKNGRSLGQTVELLSKSGNTLALSSPLYMDFPTAYNPAVLKCGNTFKRVGVEDLRVDGGIGNFSIIYGENCWLRNVESSNNLTRHILLANSYRCVVRDSYLHEAQNYDSGGNAYGIALFTYTSDSLVENNIAVHMHFNVVFGTSGGGNVVAYNYTDDSILGEDATWLMPSIGGHLMAPHHELVEGNWASQICMDTVHGGSLDLTVFRNYAAGQNSRLLRHSSEFSVAINARNYEANLLGNVWWRSGVSGQYNQCDSRGPYQIGGYNVLGNGCTTDPLVQATILRNGNFDYVTNTVRWGEDDANDPDFPGLSHTLPASLYLAAKPAWWGNLPWPYVDTARPVGSMVGTLPAKARYDAMMNPISTYAAWRTANFAGADLSNDAVSGPLADPDGAGLRNLLRYAFNLPARGAVAAPYALGTTTSGGQNYLTLSFDRRATATDLSYVVEASSDLLTWATVTTFPPGSPTRVTGQDSVAMGAVGTTRRFLRVRIQVAP